MPEIEKQRNDLIININQDKQQLLFLEDKILKLLFASKGNILDDEELVETLNESKETSSVIAVRLVDAEKTEEFIVEEREKYRSLAKIGAIMFFVLMDLADIDRMYQYSLSYFTKVYCGVMTKEAPKMTLEYRINFLTKEQTYAIYCNISRGLFEKHKLMFSFLLATATREISNDQMDFLLRGAVVSKKQSVPKPKNLISLTDHQWASCLHLQNEYTAFENLAGELEKTIEFSLHNFEIQLTNGSEKSKIRWNAQLSDFQKLMLISVLQPTQLVRAVGAYVELILGKEFTESSSTENLGTIYLDTLPNIPLIFVLSPGSDPLSGLQKLAKELEFFDNLHTVSLGQGQGEIAERLIGKGRKMGYWVFLQNCHVSTSWMPKLEAIVRNISNSTNSHEKFRLFLSSMPSNDFPVSILRNSLKVTNEPPRGIRANLTKSVYELDQELFETHVMKDQWRALVFGMSIFHAVVLERRKFGALGWNIRYDVRI
jgi:dynein heavy chain